MNGKPQVHTDNLAAKLSALPTLTREQLFECWNEQTAEPMPPSISTSLLRRAVGYVVQEQRHGCLPKQQVRMLKRLGQDTRRETLAWRSSCGDEARERQAIEASASPATGNPVRQKTREPRTGIILRPGTRLVREWQGRSHAVDVRANGFGWNGKVYRSLSAVATAITGVHWSGNRFFRV